MQRIGKALDTAAELPLSIAECAYDVALLGCEAAQHAAARRRRGRVRRRRSSPRPRPVPPPASSRRTSSPVPATSASSTRKRLADAATVAAKRAVAASASR